MIIEINEMQVLFAIVFIINLLEFWLIYILNKKILSLQIKKAIKEMQPIPTIKIKGLKKINNENFIISNNNDL